MYNKKFVSTKIWRKTWQNLKVLAAFLDTSAARLLHQLVADKADEVGCTLPHGRDETEA